MSNNQKLSLSVLVLVFLLLGGIYVYNALIGVQPQSTAKKTSNPNAPNSVPPALVADVKVLLSSFPGTKSTTEEAETFNKSVAALAVEGSSVDIGKCSPQPVILHVKSKKSFKVKNTDSVAHTIKHSAAGINANVPPGGEKELMIENSGAYGYGCDVKGVRLDPVGIFYVTAN